jgi:hypothetical protein
MRMANLSNRSLEELISRYVEIGLAQDQTLTADRISEFNRLFDEKIAIDRELKGRRGDERRFLTFLCEHQNPQVRLNAIKATLAVAPDLARAALERLANSGEHPQSMDAGMTIIALDRGTFKPE